MCGVKRETGTMQFKKWCHFSCLSLLIQWN